METKKGHGTNIVTCLKHKNERNKRRKNGDFPPDLKHIDEFFHLPIIYRSSTVLFQVRFFKSLKRVSDRLQKGEDDDV
jgi:hypothetical protein